MSRPPDKSRAHRLGDLQLKIMQCLWERGEATVAAVIESLDGHKELAYTTVATMLRKMEGRGLVAHREEGRSFVYRARVAAQEVSRSMSSHLVDRLFEGSLTDAVSHLLSTREISEEELEQLERLIRQRRRKS
jgi:BlaI family transcriptional regulator, penicillinase repressor